MQEVWSAEVFEVGIGSFSLVSHTFCFVMLDGSSLMVVDL